MIFSDEWLVSIDLDKKIREIFCVKNQGGFSIGCYSPFPFKDQTNSGLLDSNGF